MAYKNSMDIASIKQIENIETYKREEKKKKEKKLICQMEGETIKMSQQSNTTWIFVNKTTGNQMESNDFRVLIHQVRELWNLDLPQDVDVDLIMFGRYEGVVTDDEGNEHTIVIGEHSPERGIFFQKEQVVN